MATPANLLIELLRGAVDDARERERALSAAELRELIATLPAPIDATGCLRRAELIHVIAEVKRKSPSKGELAAIADPAALAAAYERGGASAISVLTEARRFGGSLDDLRAVRARVSVPVLRKDFIATEYQLLEARAAGADLVLLIVSALDLDELASLHARAEELGLSVLVEVHDDDELDRAIDIGARIIGVNARDLKTFELDRGLFARLAARIPEGVIRVAESAVATPDDVAEYRRAGADAVLIGEALVTGDSEATLRAFREASRGI